MRPDLATMIERVIALRAQARGRPRGDDQALLAEIEDALTEGYAHALAGDAWSTRSEQRLHELINGSRSPLRGRDLRSLAAEHGRLQGEVVALRRELSQLRRDRDRLRAGSHARSG